MIIKSGGFREPRTFSDTPETEKEVVKEAAHDDQLVAIGSGLGIFGGLVGGLASVSKGDLRIEDYNRIHNRVLPVSFWSSLSPSLGLHVRVESKPDGALIFLGNEQSSLQTTAEFYASPTILTNLRVEHRGFFPMSLKDVTGVHSHIEGDTEVLDFFCRLIPLSPIKTTHAFPLRGK